MKKVINKINKRLNTSKRRTFGLYNNIIAGIITGGCIGSIFPLFKGLGKQGFIFNWFINILLIFIFLLVGYNAGKWALKIATKDNSEFPNYTMNFIAGITASVYTIAIISLTLFYRLTILIPLSVVILIIILYCISKRRKK